MTTLSASALDRGGLGGLPLDELDFGGEKSVLGRAPARHGLRACAAAAYSPSAHA